MSNTKTSPGEPIPNLTICALGGVSDARIEDGCVIGHWKDPIEWTAWRYVQKQLTVAEKFLNWEASDDTILRFVINYGPVARDQLHSGFGKKTRYAPVVPSSGAQFRMGLDSWRIWQEQMRHHWHSYSQRPDSSWAFNVLDGEWLRFDQKAGLQFQALNPTRFVYAVVMSCPWERMRICPRPDCKSKYFIARHRGAVYCGAACAAWGQRASKRAWWRTKRGRIPKQTRQTNKKRG